MDAGNHITTIEQACKDWFQPDNLQLMKAIDHTVEDQLFTLEDVKHQIKHLKKCIEDNDIREWAGKAGLSDQKNAFSRKILCLHAGNIPLVGFQTALGVILTGADYFGKISRKDPYLLGAFLKHLSSYPISNNITFSSELASFKKLEADYLVFAGSERTVSVVEERAKNLQAINEQTKKIVRTSAFSVAYLKDTNALTFELLAEAILRYNGQGCRSVATVIAPVELDSIKCEFTDYIEQYWLNNPPVISSRPDLEYRYALNKAVNISQAWLDHFLIQQSTDIPGMKGLVNWIPGDEHTLRNLIKEWEGKVQSVYTLGHSIDGLKTELLSTAQRPKLYWKPDGLDIIEEILNS